MISMRIALSDSVLCCATTIAHTVDRNICQRMHHRTRCKGEQVRINRKRYSRFVYIMYSCTSVCVCVIISEHRAQSKKGETCVRASTLLYSSAVRGANRNNTCAAALLLLQLRQLVLAHGNCTRPQKIGGRNHDHRVTTMLKSMCGNVCLYYTRLRCVSLYEHACASRGKLRLHSPRTQPTH